MEFNHLVLIQFGKVGKQKGQQTWYKKRSQQEARSSSQASKLNGFGADDRRPFFPLLFGFLFYCFFGAKRLCILCALCSSLACDACQSYFSNSFELVFPLPVYLSHAYSTYLFSFCWKSLLFLVEKFLSCSSLSSVLFMILPNFSWGWVGIGRRTRMFFASFALPSGSIVMVFYLIRLFAIDQGDFFCLEPTNNGEYTSSSFFSWRSG